MEDEHKKYWEPTQKRWTCGEFAIGYAPAMEDFSVNFVNPTDVICLYLTGFKATVNNHVGKMVNMEVNPGESSFSPIGVDQIVETRRTAEMLYVSCPFGFRDKFIEQINPSTKLDDANRPGILLPHQREISRLVFDFLASEGFGGKMKAEAIASLLMVDVFREVDRPADYSKNYGLGAYKLKLITSFIAEHTDEDLSIERLAKMADVSTFHFARMFKKDMGISPHQYVIQHRIARARQLLRDPGSSIADIAYQTGFSSQSHLTDTFQKVVGVTPAKYRRVILS